MKSLRFVDVVVGLSGVYVCDCVAGVCARDGINIYDEASVGAVILMIMWVHVFDLEKLRQLVLQSDDDLMRRFINKNEMDETDGNGHY